MYELQNQIIEEVKVNDLEESLMRIGVYLIDKEDY